MLGVGGSEGGGSEGGGREGGGRGESGEDRRGGKEAGERLFQKERRHKKLLITNSKCMCAEGRGGPPLKHRVPVL